MARLPYVAPDGDVTARIRERRGGRLTALDGMLLHSPEFADGWNSMLGAVRGASTLPPDVRELVILRVASRNGASLRAGWRMSRWRGRPGSGTSSSR